MKISCVKSKNDNKSFKILKFIGAEVHELEDLEQIDKKLAELILRQK